METLSQKEKHLLLNEAVKKGLSGKGMNRMIKQYIESRNSSKNCHRKPEIIIIKTY